VVKDDLLNYSKALIAMLLLFFDNIMAVFDAVVAIRVRECVRFEWRRAWQCGERQTLLPTRQRTQTCTLAVEGHHELESGSCVEHMIA
jgi:hypothetical protein